MGLKDQLYEELFLKLRIEIEGINARPKDFVNLALGTEYIERVHIDPEKLTVLKPGTLLPSGFRTPHGLHIGFPWNPKSAFGIAYHDGEHFLQENGKDVFPIHFDKRPKYYSEDTTDGVPMRWISNYDVPSKTVRVTYSNQCALQDKGLDCKFCHGQAAHNPNNVQDQLKNPRQIGETYAKAIELDGAAHFQLTGGFLPERREVEYYLDIAEALADYTGLEDFNANACVGAPADLTVLERYKEAGFKSIASNLEIWDEGIFKAICPGKYLEVPGGWKHWVEALEYGAQVFGFGEVGSNFVGGLEPKDSLLEGVQYLAEKGVVAGVSIFHAVPGSGLDGHRCPEPDWYFGVGKEIYKIHKKHGFSFRQLSQVKPGNSMLEHDIFRIEEGIPFD
ncbi:MAG: nitrogen fixation protein NifB [Eubacteriales bacterium]|nr:nitrogen fixation protein NifB [Eubacteriales bacterium]